MTSTNQFDEIIEDARQLIQETKEKRETLKKQNDEIAKLIQTYQDTDFSHKLAQIKKINISTDKFKKPEGITLENFTQPEYQDIHSFYLQEKIRFAIRASDMFINKSESQTPFKFSTLDKDLEKDHETLVKYIQEYKNRSKRFQQENIKKINNNNFEEHMHNFTNLVYDTQ